MVVSLKVSFASVNNIFVSEDRYIDSLVRIFFLLFSAFPPLCQIDKKRCQIFFIIVKPNDALL